MKTWYQNRRTKWKRQSSLGIEWLIAAAALEQQQQAYAAVESQTIGTTSSSSSSSSSPNSNNNQTLEANTESAAAKLNSWFVSALTQYSMGASSAMMVPNHPPESQTITTTNPTSTSNSTSTSTSNSYCCF